MISCGGFLMSKYIALIFKVIKNEMNCILQKTPEALIKSAFYENIRYEKRDITHDVIMTLLSYSYSLSISFSFIFLSFILTIP